MQAHVLRGTKRQIAESLAQIPGEVREAIVFVEEPATAAAQMPESEDLFAEMRPYMVDVEDLDDGREAIYTRPSKLSASRGSRRGTSGARRKACTRSSPAAPTVPRIIATSQRPKTGWPAPTSGKICR